MTHDLAPTEPTWAIAHNGTIAHYVPLDAGQNFSTGMPNLETFQSEAAADTRMRDFDPLWKVGPLDVNTASAEDLDALPGVGETIAAAIVAGRPYATVSDLEAVDGISASMIEGWGAAVLVDPDTFAAYVPPPPPPEPPYPIDKTISDLAALRWAREVGGLTLPDGRQIRTTRESQAQLDAAVNAATRGALVPPLDFKLLTGWVSLSEADLIAIAAAVTRHVQACFGAERDVETHLRATDLYWLEDIEGLFNAAYAARMGA